MAVYGSPNSQPGIAGKSENCWLLASRGQSINPQEQSCELLANCIHRLPERTAAVSADDVLNYAQWEQRSNQ